MNKEQAKNILRFQEELLSKLRSERDFEERQLLALDKKINLVKKTINDLKVYYDIDGNKNLQI